MGRAKALLGNLSGASSHPQGQPSVAPGETCRGAPPPSIASPLRKRKKEGPCKETCQGLPGPSRGPAPSETPIEAGYVHEPADCQRA
eukprot:CAMPEP_0180639576 /NCGR_PEP_ID=MMETSP1037_2-20121125/45114_1 /TAXON_ID=632150 /ORGANISM="Azadinium spinosum, Strain 3D9" /LENGTH=86 /DNA_ID=CAMNT_0022661545 /DNA_START=85 /DNA_END=345 /DNA_ORIENTATION=+